MKHVILFGVGSPLVIDLEESCARCGFDIVAGVQNVDGPIYVTAAVRLLVPTQLTPAELGYPFGLAMATPANRRRAFDAAVRLGFSRAATVVDPTSIVARSTALGEGVFVNAGCVIGGGGTIGDLALINRGANLGHHAVIEAFATIGPGVVIAGSVRVGRGAFIGAGAVVLPKIEIGNNAVIGAGAVITRSVPANTTVAGNPARVLKVDHNPYGDTSG
jgi:sugar O-acyltransferase (sialic acid O-acetyltransferase NeuD family)